MRSDRARRFGGSEIDAFVMGRPQVFQNRGRDGAVKLNFGLPVHKPIKRLVELALKRLDLLFDTIQAPFDIAFYIMAQAIFQMSTDHSLFLR